MATAAFLIEKGCKVAFCDTQAEDFPAIERQGGIIARGCAMRGCFKPLLLTDNFQEAVEFGKIVVICASVSRHKSIVEQCAPLARPGQLFLFNPGNLGALVMRRKLSKLDISGVYTADFSGSLWACRRTGPGEVIVALPFRPGKPLAACPASDTEHVIELLAPVMEASSSANVFEAALNSPNVVSHVGGALLNAVQVEAMKEKFIFYLHGLGEPVFTLNEALENERNQVMDQLGLAVYSRSGNGFLRLLMEYDSHPELDYFRNLDGPSSLSHRYVSEDAACGVSLLISLAHKLEIPVPLTEATVAIAGCLNHTDYLKDGYSLSYFDFDGKSVQEILSEL